MARQINAGENVGRTDVFMVDPREVVIQPKMRGRWDEAPPSQDAILELAESFLAHGQSNPCVAHKRPADKRLVIEQGQTRHAAALWIVENREPKFRLKVTCVDRNEEDGFVCAIEENRIRTQLSPMDDAANLRQLREQFGWDDSKVRDLFKCRPDYLRQLEVLLTLPKKIQLLVHQDKLGVSNAVLLANLTGPELEAALTEALAVPVSKNGRVNSGAVRTAVRERLNGHGGAKASKRVARTLKDLRTKFSGFIGNEDVPPKAREFAEVLLGYVKGDFGDRKFDSRIAEIFGSKK